MARVDTLLDDCRKRRSSSGGSNSIDPCQLWHAAKSSLFARVSHFGQCKLPSCRICPSGDSENFSTSSFSYLADLKPSGNLGELVNPGPVKIDGSIYPKSILFSCNVGDPTAFPAYKLKHNARRFQATIGLGAKFPPHFEAGIILIGDGRYLRTFNVSGLKPKTVDVNVTGVHTLQLECFGSGQSSSAGWAVTVAWGNARVTERH